MGDGNIAGPPLLSSFLYLVRRSACASDFVSGVLEPSVYEWREASADCRKYSRVIRLEDSRAGSLTGAVKE